MMNIELKKGAILTHQELIDKFSVANMGGMRHSVENNVLILIHKHGSLYQDRWKDGVLLYTGMGKKGDQDINFRQNKTLAQSGANDVKVLLFSSTASDEYVFEGEVVLASEPYYEIQSDEADQKRKVIIFPLKLVN